MDGARRMAGMSQIQVSGLPLQNKNIGLREREIQCHFSCQISCGFYGHPVGNPPWLVWRSLPPFGEHSARLAHPEFGNRNNKIIHYSLDLSDKDKLVMSVAAMKIDGGSFGDNSMR